MCGGSLEGSKPMLKENNVRLIGVGLEAVGVKEFIDAKYLEGEVYIDEGKKSYAALNFKRISFFQLFPALLSAAARAARSRAKALGLGGNTHGDGWQNGGCLVVEKGGGEKPLLFYVQENAPAIVSNHTIFQVLGIEGDPPEATPVKTSSCHGRNC